MFFTINFSSVTVRAPPWCLSGLMKLLWVMAWQFTLSGSDNHFFTYTQPTIMNTCLTRNCFTAQKSSTVFLRQFVSSWQIYGCKVLLISPRVQENRIFFTKQKLFSMQRTDLNLMYSICMLSPQTPRKPRKQSEQQQKVGGSRTNKIRPYNVTHLYVVRKNPITILLITSKTQLMPSGN